MNLFGVCFDEYAVTDSSQPWDLVRPILAENGGWACSLSTPNGRNHFWTLYQQARESPDWFTTLKSIDDTRRDAPGEDGRPIVTRAQVAEEIRAEMPEAFARQEFDVSFLAATPGAYYATELERVEREGRIRNLPWTPALPVLTSWDLGIGHGGARVKRVFLCGRLKYSRLSGVRWRTQIDPETLCRAMLEIIEGWGRGPWAWVFDNMKTVTLGQDAAGLVGTRPSGASPRRSGSIPSCVTPAQPSRRHGGELDHNVGATVPSRSAWSRRP